MKVCHPLYINNNVEVYMEQEICLAVKMMNHYLAALLSI